MTTVRIELNDDQVTCFREHHCFADFFSERSEIPVGHPVIPFFSGEDLEDAVVVAIQEVRIRDENDDIMDGFIFIFAGEMEVKTVDQSSGMIIQPKMVGCYQEYGYVVLPFAEEDDLPIGGVMRFTNTRLNLEPGIIVAVQKFMPSWQYLFIVAKPPK